MEKQFEMPSFDKEIVKKRDDIFGVPEHPAKGSINFNREPVCILHTNDLGISDNNFLYFVEYWKEDCFLANNFIMLDKDIMDSETLLTEELNTFCEDIAKGGFITRVVLFPVLFNPGYTFLVGGVKEKWNNILSNFSIGHPMEFIKEGWTRVS